MSNHFAKCLECCLEHLLNYFEDFIKKSLIIFTLALGTAICILVYGLKALLSEHQDSSAISSLIPNLQQNGQLQAGRSPASFQPPPSNMRKRLFDDSDTNQAQKTVPHKQAYDAEEHTRTTPDALKLIKEPENERFQEGGSQSSYRKIIKSSIRDKRDLNEVQSFFDSNEESRPFEKAQLQGELYEEMTPSDEIQNSKKCIKRKRILNCSGKHYVPTEVMENLDSVPDNYETPRAPHVTSYESSESGRPLKEENIRKTPRDIPKNIWQQQQQDKLPREVSNATKTHTSDFLQKPSRNAPGAMRSYAPVDRLSPKNLEIEERKRAKPDARCAAKPNKDGKTIARQRLPNNYVGNKVSPVLRDQKTDIPFQRLPTNTKNIVRPLSEDNRMRISPSNVSIKVEPQLQITPNNYEIPMKTQTTDISQNDSISSKKPQEVMETGIERSFNESESQRNHQRTKYQSPKEYNQLQASQVEPERKGRQQLDERQVPFSGHMENIKSPADMLPWLPYLMSLLLWGQPIPQRNEPFGNTEVNQSEPLQFTPDLPFDHLKSTEDLEEEDIEYKKSTDQTKSPNASHVRNVPQSGVKFKISSPSASPSSWRDESDLPQYPESILRSKPIGTSNIIKDEVREYDENYEYRPTPENEWVQQIPQKIKVTNIKAEPETDRPLQTDQSSSFRIEPPGTSRQSHETLASPAKKRPDLKDFETMRIQPPPVVQPKPIMNNIREGIDTGQSPISVIQMRPQSRRPREAMEYVNPQSSVAHSQSQTPEIERPHKPFDRVQPPFSALARKLHTSHAVEKAHALQDNELLTPASPWDNQTGSSQDTVDVTSIPTSSSDYINNFYDEQMHKAIEISSIPKKKCSMCGQEYKSIRLCVPSLPLSVQSVSSSNPCVPSCASKPSTCLSTSTRSSCCSLCCPNEEYQ